MTPFKLRLHLRTSMIVVLAGVSGWQLGSAVYLQAKATLAQYLLEDAWAESLALGAPVKPWAWADTWPVARLQVPAAKVDLIVLAGDSGQALAFGPGQVSVSAAPGTGHTIIGGHRNTHFAFLRSLPQGSLIRLQGGDGVWNNYRISAARIADSRREALALDNTHSSLSLVTCWPFDALTAGGPLRYVVSAVPVQADLGRPVS